MPLLDHRPTNEPILTTDREEIATTWALVLAAVRIPHRIRYHNQTWYLQVPAGSRQRATHELESYFAENINWPPRHPQPIQDFTPLMQPPTLLLIGGLVLFYGLTGPWEAQSPWFLQGAGNSERILENGEWWRLLTALTLHADTVHLLGNCLVGGWLVHCFCQMTGTGLGLCALLLAAGAGNLINVWIHGTGHHFVGFSTAVFAVIGMLAVLTHQRRKTLTGSHFLLPVMAGAALLAALGSSGERTDLGAHFFGLICGLLSGYLLSRQPLHRWGHSLVFQFLCFLLFFSLLMGSWMRALRP